MTTTSVDPKPSVDRIDELASRIINGDILLPKFQRDFVWEREQILELLDSVMKNYPIGSVLLWLSTQRLKSERTIADLLIKEKPEEYPTNYLLDGQQRLSTICGALYWSGDNPDSVWNIAYDLRKKEFVHLSSLDDVPSYQIRMNLLQDPSKFFMRLNTLDSSGLADFAELKTRGNELFNRFKDYKLAVVTLGDMSIEDVAPIFERINSTGKRLTIVDLMRAATWSQQFDLIDTIDETILSALSEKKFADIDRKVVLRNLSAAVGGGFDADSIDNLRKFTPETLNAASEEVLEAYKKAVDFLATQLSMASAAAIPYANQFVVLAEVFRRLPAPSAEQYAIIRTWFWQTALSGYFSGWNTGQMNQDLNAVSAFAKGETETIAPPLIKPRDEVWERRQFRSNNALSKVFGHLLACQGPIDLVNGNNIDTTAALSWMNQKEFHHFFPQTYLKRQGVDSGRINAMANIVMLSSVSNKQISDQAPGEYLPPLLNSEHANASLRASLISPEALEAALQNNFDKFLAVRARDISEKTAELAHW